jgi:hypothetical protein
MNEMQEEGLAYTVCGVICAHDEKSPEGREGLVDVCLGMVPSFDGGEDIS